MSDIEPFVDPEKAAAFLGVRRRRLLQMARAGEIPAHPIGSHERKTWRFKLSELAQAVMRPTTDVGNQGSRYHQSGQSLAVPRTKGH